MRFKISDSACRLKPDEAQKEIIARVLAKLRGMNVTIDTPTEKLIRTYDYEVKIGKVVI